MERCKICGKLFTKKRWNECYCSIECKSVARKGRDKKRIRKYKPKKEPNADLVRLAIEAREHGMTYGQYVAQLKE